MTKHSKEFLEARGKVDREFEYEPADAVGLVKDLARAKFDESVEVHIRTGLNVRHADEQLRGTIALPNGLGKSVSVAVFAQGDKAREAEEAGADVVGAEDLAKRVEEGFDDFDVAIATPDLMPVVGRLGRVLGPSGKMPNPKVGTVTMDVAKAVEEAKAGKVEYRTDRNAIVHLVIGKASFDDARAARELRRGHGRDGPRQAAGRQGQVHQVDHDHLDAGPRRQDRPHPTSRHSRGGRAGRGVVRESRHRRPPAARDGGWKTGRGGS